MPNRHGDLNIKEAAAYLSVPVDILKSLYEADAGPGHYPEKHEQAQFPDGPWFPKWALDQYRPILWIEAATLLPDLELSGPAGTPKSTLAKHVPGGVVVLGG